MRSWGYESQCRGTDRCAEYVVIQYPRLILRRRILCRQQQHVADAACACSYVPAFHIAEDHLQVRLSASLY